MIIQPRLTVTHGLGTRAAPRRPAACPGPDRRPGPEQDMLDLWREDGRPASAGLVAAASALVVAATLLLARLTGVA
ncbi:hypothetical protein M0638_17665 [Roseomonas sp. NAR14]|uniref:Uncharacterized protein n=1 Tax=Roseomonas acroporae TaxID=2937791 RepID=A0A9X2BV24_9PROT|nr:hypothetical protein [Roseomonas acroporae]MCK8786207.1 hypothetical protein [Roseomonas acroporae]